MWSNGEQRISREIVELVHGGDVDNGFKGHNQEDEEDADNNGPANPAGGLLGELLGLSVPASLNALLQERERERERERK